MGGIVFGAQHAIGKAFELGRVGVNERGEDRTQCLGCNWQQALCQGGEVLTPDWIALPAIGSDGRHAVLLRLFALGAGGQGHNAVGLQQFVLNLAQMGEKHQVVARGMSSGKTLEARGAPGEDTGCGCLQYGGWLEPWLRGCG